MTIIERLTEVANFLWGWPLIIVIAFTGIFLTIRTGGVQFRRFGYMLKTTFGSITQKESEIEGTGLMKPLKLALAAMAGTIGTGNIAGVGMAIGVGGPGAVFWMWVVALFSMITKYSEIVLGVHYREYDENTQQYDSGPMYYIKKGLGSKWVWLATTYALLFGLAYFVMAFVQSNTIAIGMKDLLGAKPLLTGLILAAIMALVVFGGLKSLVKVSEVLVPVMSIFYVLAALFIIIANIGKLPSVLATIVSSAFTGSAAVGGFLGSTVVLSMRQGFARGIFSNDGGVGLGAIVHGQGITTHPAKQGMWGLFEVFIDTIVVCTATACVIMFTGAYETGYKGLSLTAEAFSIGLPGSFAGKALICLSVALFGFTTCINNNYLFTQAMNYVFHNVKYKIIVIICGVLSLGGAVYGALGGLEDIWGMADLFLAIVIIINLPVVIALSGKVKELTRDFFGTNKWKEDLERQKARKAKK